jgi:hypothetical protein
MPETSGQAPNKEFPAVSAFLAERGLRLSPVKTRITHIETRAEATVFDPDYASYFRERELRKGSLARHWSVVQPAF